MASSSYSCWCDELTLKLIKWRTENEGLFTGKKYSAIEGFTKFVEDNGLSGKEQPRAVKKRWENLQQKYKEYQKSPTSELSKEEREAAQASWKWFDVMHAALGNKQPMTSSGPISPSSQDIAVVSTAPVSDPEDEDDEIPSSKRRRVEGPVSNGIKPMEEREQRREAELRGKKEQIHEKACGREAEARVRKERRAEEARAREERREEEARAREERREEEARAREERREEEARAREERREEEARAREEEFKAREERWEERFLALLEAITKK